MRAPLPRENLQPGSSPLMQGGNVVPFRDYSAEQTQALGQTMLKGGLELANTTDWLQDRYDEAEAKGADSRLAETIHKVMRDPKVGYLNQLGKGAVGKPREDAFAQIDKEIESTIQSLGNEQQREMFRRVAGQRRLEAIADADAHETKQVRVYAAGESEARARAFGRDAVTHAGDPTRFQKAMGSLRSEVDAGADMLGWEKDSKQRAEMHLQATTAVHGSIIAAMADGGDAAGVSKWLASYGDQIDPQEREKLERITRKATANDKATKYADAYREGARTEVKTNRQYGIADQGERIAAGNRPFTDADIADAESRAMRLVREDFDAGRITADEREAIERKLAGRFQDDRSVAARVSVGVLNEAKQWAHDNPGVSFDEAPQTLRDRVEQLNLAPDVGVVVETYGVGRTDSIGAEALMRAEVDKEWLRSIKTPEEIHKQYSGHMTATALGSFARSWQEARTPGALPKDVVGERVRNAVYDNMGLLGAFLNKRTIPNDVFARAERMQNTILARIATVSGGKEDRQTTDLVDAEITSELSQKAKLWGSRQEVPLGSMSPTERATAIFETQTGYTVYRKGSVAPGVDYNVIERDPRWIPMTQADEERATKFLEEVNAGLLLRGEVPIPITAQQIAEYLAEDHERVNGHAPAAVPASDPQGTVRSGDVTGMQRAAGF